MAEGVFYRASAPSGPAAAVVECYWELKAPASDAAELIPPDACAELLFHLGAPPSDAHGVQAPAFVAGPTTAPVRLARDRALHVRAVRLTPWGAGAVLGSAAFVLADAALGFEHLEDWTARLADAAREAGPLEAFARRAEALIEARLAAAAPEPFLARRLTGLGDDALRVRDLASLSGWTTRTLERRWRAETGLSPRAFLQIRRFQRARDRIAGSREPLSAVAAACGFADQAHLSRDFKRFAGETPAALRRRSRGVFDALFDAGRDAHWR